MSNRSTKNAEANGKIVDRASPLTKKLESIAFGGGLLRFQNAAREPEPLGHRCGADCPREKVTPSEPFSLFTRGR
jgi:hypothetical protein